MFGDHWVTGGVQSWNSQIPWLNQRLDRPKTSGAWTCIGPQLSNFWGVRILRAVWYEVKHLDIDRVWWKNHITLRLPTPPMETPDPPSDTPGASKQVVLTPHDIPRSLRAYVSISQGCFLGFSKWPALIFQFPKYLEPSYTPGFQILSKIHPRLDLPWIYPPPSNSGKWRSMGIPY